jgi:AAA15 family ATPase/GTPase
MFESLTLKNFGTFSEFTWTDHAPINIIIGENDTGKTYILKSLYCLAKSIQEYTISKQQKTWKGILADKIYNVYQPTNDKLGSLVKKGSETKPLSVEAKVWGNNYEFEFGKDTKNTITQGSEEIFKPLEPRSLYIPTKEVLTALNAIASTKNQIGGFDETYHDLIDAIRIPITKEKIKKLSTTFKKALQALDPLFDGEVILRKDEFILKRGRETYNMAQIAEGIKKLSILITLIRNQSIQKGTILILDEPETSLHPRAIIAFCEMLFYLSQAGIQVYLATHSYFVIKQFELLARKHKQTIQICSLVKSEGSILTEFRDLQRGLPDNPIIDVSIKLYEDDVRLCLE